MVAPPLLAGAEKDTVAEAIPAVAKAAVGGSGADVRDVIVTEPMPVPIPVVLDWDVPLLNEPPPPPELRLLQEQGSNAPPPPPE